MRFVLLLLALFAIATVGGAAFYLAWDIDWRWRPHTITQHAAEIAQALDQSGWVSPHLTGPKVYVIVSSSCPPCKALEAQAIPKLQGADVDTRMVVVAAPDENGQAKSSPQDRAVVAELWTNRSWKLFQQWSAPAPAKPPAPATTPAMPAIAPADGDSGRTAVVQASRALATNLAPLLKDNGVQFAYPTLVWWTKDGRMRACACVDPRSYRFVEKELGA
jgi:hypothetical protein